MNNINSLIPFSEQRLPEEFSIGASGGPEYSTNILTMANGVEQRNINWRSARSRYDLYPSLKTTELIEKLINFFRAHKGRAIGFRYKDWSDYSAYNERIAIADGVSRVFQLVKSYELESINDVKIIRKPVSGTVNIFVDGQTTKFNCDYTSGKITFESPPLNGAVITASFEFDLPVRFDTDYLDLSVESINAKDFTIPVLELVTTDSTLLSKEQEHEKD